MFKKPFLIVAAALATALVMSSLVLTQNVKSAGTNPRIFLRVQGIQGESTDAGHRGEIDILSFDWMEAMQGMSDAEAGILTMSDFNFTMVTNKASPEIFLAVATGRICPDAKLTVSESTGMKQVEFLTWEFRDVRFTFFSQSGTTNNRPIEKFSIAFSWMRITCTQILPNGSPGTQIREEWPTEA